MNTRALSAVLLFAAAMPAGAQDMFPNYWDRYAVKMSREVVAEDSDTSPAYRNQYAVMTLDEASRVAAARQAREAKERLAQDVVPPAREGARRCACENKG
ncbi:MAG: hypothetical protein ACJ79V_08070 [Myxococcales bacterium]